MSVFTDTEMESLPASEQAQKAILHALQQICRNPAIGWHMGIGTQSFALLTEAFATITGRKVEDVRNAWSCKDADPVKCLPDETLIGELQRRGFEVKRNNETLELINES